MKACVFYGPGNLKVEEKPTPSPNAGEVLIKTKAASLCFSDIRVFRGEKKARSGVIQGHEIAGEVVKVGEGVREIKVGDPVALCPIIACGACYFCIRGKRNRCLNRETLGYEIDGGLAEYVIAPKELVSLGHVLKLPSALKWDIACQMEPFACALYSLEACRIGAGTSLTIVGAGPMGLTHLMIARGMGCSTTIVIDPVEERLAIAAEMGATAVVNPSKEKVGEVVMGLTHGIGTDAAVVSVGNVNAIETGLGAVRKLGIVNIFGGCPPGSLLSLDPNLIHYNEIWLTGTQNANPEHYQRALELLTRTPLAGRLITNRYSIQDAPNAFQTRAQMQGLKAVIDF